MQGVQSIVDQNTTVRDALLATRDKPLRAVGAGKVHGAWLRLPPIASVSRSASASLSCVPYTRAVWPSRLSRGYVADWAGCSSMLLRPMCYSCLLHPASLPVLFCWLPSFCQHSPPATTRTCHSSFGFPFSSPYSLSVAWCRHGGRRGQGRQRARQHPPRRTHRAAAASPKLSPKP